MSIIFAIGVTVITTLMIGLPLMYSDTFYYLASWSSRILSRKRSYLSPLMRWRIRRYVANVNSWETLKYCWDSDGLHTSLKVEVRRDSDQATARTRYLLQFPLGITDKYGYSILGDCKKEAAGYLEEVINDYAR